MMAPWLAAPKSLDGLAAFGGFSVVVVLACMVVPLCDAVGGIVVPVAGDEAFDEVSLAGMVVAVCGEDCRIVEPGELVTFAFCVIGVTALSDPFLVGVHVPLIHVPLCISADLLSSTASFSPGEYRHGVSFGAGVVLFTGSVLLHANVQFV